MIDFNEIVKIIIEKGYYGELRDIARNGSMKQAIIIGPAESQVLPVIFLEDIDLSEPLTPEEIADKFIEIAKANFIDSNEIDLSMLNDWNRAKDRLYLCMSYRCTLNSNVYTKPFLADIVQYIRVRIENALPDESLVASVAVTRDLAQQWSEAYNLEAGEIFDIAQANSQGNYIVQDLWEIFGDGQSDLDIPQAEMLILSNEERTHGATVLTDIETLNKASDILGGDFYIIPSSVHEVMAVKVRDGVNAEQLRTRVQEVNDNELEPKELLSYSVFFYERSSETVKQAG